MRRFAHVVRIYWQEERRLYEQFSLEVANWQKSFAEELTVLLLSHGRVVGNRVKVIKHAGHTL